MRASQLVRKKGEKSLGGAINRLTEGSPRLRAESSRFRRDCQTQITFLPKLLLLPTVTKKSCPAGTEQAPFVPTLACHILSNRGSGKRTNLHPAEKLNASIAAA